jgi:hypothetical protein
MCLEKTTSPEQMASRTHTTQTAAGPIRRGKAGGFPACGRWLSLPIRATPQDLRPKAIRTPAGVPAAWERTRPQVV